MRGELGEKYKIFIRTHKKISILMDSVKGFFVALLIFLLIVCVLSAIVHNILKVVEVSNDKSGEYKKLYTAGDGMMNLYTVGDGFRTVVILPELGTMSPVMKYKAISDALSIEYRVVIAEPIGYGYSLSTKKDRTSENIVNELRDALNDAEIEGPYLLLSFSNSSLYADYYSQKYPEEVLGVISANPMYPESLNSEKFKDDYLPNAITNVKFFSVFAFSGYYRWKSYISPKAFQIDKMQSSDSYKKEDISLYRNRIANRFLTKEMKNEIIKLESNMKELKDYKYPDNLLTLQIITTNYRDEYLDRQENISKYANNLITNKDIQLVRTIEGDINDYLYTKDGIRDLRNLISSNF